ncbi:GNAT family N-acetyltransferase [Kribbella sp. NPDC051620]|uniref:GNAT family N-acetyltransferase n=1 Tax=Kribbella sp. NPDC051620 TaxID=3364120 RepID=UPI0037B45E2A
MSWPVLTGPRVTLRVLTMADVDAWLAGDDEAQQRWFEAPGPAPRENVVRLVETSRNSWETSGPKRHWAIWLDGILAGGIDIEDRGQGSAYLSYVVFPPSRRQGVAAESIPLVTTWAFTAWPITRAVAVIDELNTASRSTAERAGFLFEAVADPSEYGESGRMLRYVLPRA